MWILINNAAIFEPGGLAEATLGQWEQQMGINLRAPFFHSQAFARQLPAGAEGQIVNIADARVLRPGADHLVYRLTKSALVSLTQALALELAPRIRVNAVALGAILPPPGDDEAYLQALAQRRVPLRRAGNPEMVAVNVLHLLRQPFHRRHPAHRRRRVFIVRRHGQDFSSRIYSSAAFWASTRRSGSSGRTS